MNPKLKSGLLVLLAGIAPATATAAESMSVSALAETTGIQERHVRMLLGGRSGYADYRSAFDQVERKFIAAVGKERYHDLLAHKPVQIERVIHGRRVAFIVQREPST